MTEHFSRHIPVAGTYNVRDLGGYETPSGQTLWRRLLRADGLHRLDAAGMALLTEIGVRTVIDLRHINELDRQPNPFASHAGVHYHNVSLLAELAPDLAGDMIPLAELYCRVLDEQHGPIAQVFELIAEADEGALLFHCTAGKDRTGLIAALLLSLVGVNEDDILTDYAQTADYIAPLVEEIIERLSGPHTDVDNMRALLASDRAFMEAALRHIGLRYGSSAAYFAEIGLGQDVLGRVARRLIAQ